MESLDFGFVHLDNFIGLSWLVVKIRQETKQTYYVGKQKINSTGINDDCITTERPAANTRLCALAADVLLAVFAPAFPVSPLRQEIRP